MNFDFLKSKTFWVMFAGVLYNAINANIAYFPAAYSVLVNAALLVLGMIAHNSAVAEAGRTGRAKM